MHLEQPAALPSPPEPPTRPTDPPTAPADPPWDLRVQALNVCVLMACASALGLLLLLVPARQEISRQENRALAPRPTFSWSTLYEGTYLTDLDRFFADHFPFRDEFLSFAARLKQLRGFRASVSIVTPVAGELFGQEDPAQWARMVGEEAGSASPTGALPDAAWATRADPPDPGAPAAPGPPPASGTGQLAAPGSVPATAPAASPAAAPPGPANGGPAAAPVPLPGAAAPAAEIPLRKQSGRVNYTKGILIHDGMAMQLFGSTEKVARAYAEVINSYVDAVPAGVTVYSEVVPTSVSFNAPPSYHKTARLERANNEQIFGFLRPEVRRVDPYPEMAAHASEPLFLRTDHHWSGRGAYYAYVAFCKAAGVPAVPLDRMERKVKKHFIGSLYALTQDPSLNKAEEVEYWIPPVTYEAVRYEWKAQKKAVKTKFLEEAGYGYGVFLGADYPLMVAKTAVNNNRHVLIVKNSYGNPFCVFALGSFQTVVVVDYRYFSGSVVDLVREHGITDLLVLNVSLTANAEYHRQRVRRVLYGGKQPPKPGTR